MKIKLYFKDFLRILSIIQVYHRIIKTQTLTVIRIFSRNITELITINLIYLK